MKIKHYQGYGTVNATKVSKENVSGFTLLTIKVSGNHEWGLIRTDDNYTVKRWLLDKFDKAAAELSPYRDMRYTVDLAPSEEGVEVAIYKILYGKDVAYVI